MKRVLLASVGALTLAALVGPANAADLSRRYPAPAQQVNKAPIYSPVYNWTGMYIGINGGGAWGQSGWDTTGNFDMHGWLFGGTLGYNWQAGPVVFGLEGDIGWSNIGGTTTTACGLGCETRNSWLGTVRGRLGYAIDRFMPYITGGLALGDVRASTPGFAGASQTNAGWTGGGGVEFAVAPQWTAKAEYLYVDLGSFNCGLSCGAAATDNVSFRTSIIRGGINYKF
jgi:outer membrane immunogenic protein